MFDFEKLAVYSKAKSYSKEISKLLKEISIDSAIKNQLRRSSLSIVLNIAEGSGRHSKADNRNFFVISRGSVFKCVAIFDILKEENAISNEVFQNLYLKSEELSKMLYAMMISFNKKN